MAELKESLKDLDTKFGSLLKQINYDSMKVEAEKLRAFTGESDFWQDADKAQKISKRLAILDKRLEPWAGFKQELNELSELASLGDDSLESDLSQQVEGLTKQLVKLEGELRLNGPYDGHDAVLSIQAGAGGTDSQDFAQMLERMYLRWAERNQVKTKVIQESAGDEAGIKSVTIELEGKFVYGQLKGEHGVHRLVRLSPFNTAHTRETSFAKVEVTPKLDDPSELVIDEKEIKIDVYRSGGHGGQSVNTTDSAVRVTHLPTGVVVAIQNERSQLQNKEVALTILRSKLAQLQLEQHVEKLSELRPATGANEFGSQIRNYVLHPYKQVKDLRTNFVSKDPQVVLDGDLDGFIEAYLNSNLG